MKAPDFWDAVKPSRLAPGDRPAWMTFDDVWIDEVRRGLAACKVFVWFPIYCGCSMFPPSLMKSILHTVLLRVDVQPNQ